jgi:oligopeptide transport system permease protein
VLKYSLNRLFWIVLVLIAVAFITFSLMHLVPGGPWDREKELAPQVIENLNKKYGLDKPYFVQFGNYMWNVLQGDLGVSYSYQDRGVTEILMDGLPKTATLGGVAFLIAILVGIPLGMAAALKQNSIIDYIAVFFSTLFASIPGFVLGIFLVLIFSVSLHLLPTGGWGTIDHVIMPAIALAALPAAYIARVTRASMLDVLRQDYIRTARAKGLAEHVVLIRHTLRNALIPVMTVIGPELAYLITGSVVIESVFSIPGTGRLFVQGIAQRDYGLIMGTTLFYAFIIAVANYVVDVLYGVVDPRIRYD